MTSSACRRARVAGLLATLAMLIALGTANFAYSRDSMI